MILTIDNSDFNDWYRYDNSDFKPIVRDQENDESLKHEKKKKGNETNNVHEIRVFTKNVNMLQDEGRMIKMWRTDRNMPIWNADDTNEVKKKIWKWTKEN